MQLGRHDEVHGAEGRLVKSGEDDAKDDQRDQNGLDDLQRLFHLEALENDW